MPSSATRPSAMAPCVSSVFSVAFWKFVCSRMII
jgi:hypothetical protein